MNARRCSPLRTVVLAVTLLALAAAGSVAAAPPATAGAGTDTLWSTEWLPSGQELRTGNSFSLVMGPDGNLVVYRLGGPDRVALWASGTQGHPGAYLVAQDDGNLVIYQPTGNGQRVAIWASNTPRHPGAYLTVQADGNVVEYYPTGGGNRVAIWATNTATSPGTPALRTGIAAVARAELAQNPTETRNNNVVRYNGGTGALAPYNRNRSWCADFATWVWQRAGVGNPLMAHCGNGTAGTIQSWAAANREYRPLAAGARVGDLILYGSPNRCAHVAVVVGVRSDGFVQTIGGNEQGSTGNGGVRFTDWSNPRSLNHGGPAYGYASPLRGS